MAESSSPLIRRGRSNARYTTISNNIIDHPALSPEARLALIYLLSKPADWELRIVDLQRLLGTRGKPRGRDKAYAVVDELKSSAYIVAEQQKQQGRFGRLIYYVFDEPQSGGQGSDGGPPVDAEQAATRALGAPAETSSAPLPEFQEAAFPDPGVSDPGKPNLTKDRRSPSTENPPPSPGRPAAAKPAEGGGFSEFWNAWPEDTRPRERALAAKLFVALSADEQHMARQVAQAYRATRASAGEFAGMLPYLRTRLFADFAGAPAVDGGHYVITPDRPEWPSWVEHLKAHHSPGLVERQAAKGRLLTATRWPPIDGRKPPNDRASTGAGQ
jgi:hypothetical protein